MAETEDVPYSAPEFATPEPDKQPDEDQVNKGVILEVEKYLSEAIAEHNTVDVIDLTEQAKMNPTQQIAVHKLVLKHLRDIKRVIDDKLKELA